MSSMDILSVPAVNINGRVIPIKVGSFKPNLGTLEYTVTAFSIGGGESVTSRGAKASSLVGKATFNVSTSKQEIRNFLDITRSQQDKPFSVSWDQGDASYAIHNATIVNSPDMEHTDVGDFEYEIHGDPVTVVGG